MKLRNGDIEQRGQSESLVLLIPAWRLGTKSLTDVKAAVSEAMPNADLLAPDFPGSTFSEEDPVELAREYLECIDQAVSSRKARGTEYKEIIMIGHSLGALLARKIYVFARGQNHELRASGLHPKPRTWAGKITRIILFAGMNRGWSVTPKPERMPWTLALAARVILTLLHLTRVRSATLIRSIQRGAPFIANLRVQWINLIRSGTEMPLTVQLLGDDDEVVTSEDNIDLQSGRDFVYLHLPDTIHQDPIVFSGAAGTVRRKVFLKALVTPAEELKSQSEYEIPESQQPDITISALVFVMHGIRDYGGWTLRLGDFIEKKFSNVKAITSSYGRFPMGKFLLLGDRQKNVRWFMDQYTENLAKYPAAAIISFVGHSNGTYLLASALTRYAACNFDNVVFAGSVVPRNFHWDAMVANNRIRRIRNYVGTADFVVGIFPHLFEVFGWSDLGSAGLTGFIDEEGHRYEVRYVKGTHSAALAEKNFDAMADFLLGRQQCAVARELLSGRQQPFVLFLSQFCWLDWAGLIVFIFGLGWWAVWKWPWPSSGLPSWVGAALYGLLIILILNTY